MSNLKFAFRTLFKTPFVTIVAIVSLALGIGANAAIFSLFNQMLLRPLPAAEPNRLVNLLVPGPRPGSQSCNQASTRGNCDDVLSYPMFRDLEREQQGFAGLAAHRLVSANIAYGGQTVNGDLLLVSGSYFGVLGIQPALGRLIGPGDDRIIGESPVVVLSHGFWTTRFAADRGLLNQTMIVNGQAMTIVGVAPRGFTGTTIGAEPKVFVPLTLRKPVNPWSERMDNRRNYFLYVFGRLKPGVSIEQARASLDPQYRAIVNDVEAALQTGMSPQTLARFKTKPILLEPGARGQSAIPNTARPSLRLLLGVTAFVLIIACANIANLLLARSAARAGEMAVRLSIGASRGRLVFQLLTESLLLAVLGGIAGMFVAQWTLDLIASLLPNFAATTLDFHVDRTAMLFGAALTIGTGLLFGLFPAIHSTRPDLVSSLKGQAGQPSGARAAARFRTSLATAQIALSMALLVSAGLFTKKFNLGRDAVGRRIGNRGDKEGLDTQIVGLVQNAKYSEVKREVPPLFFRPYRQDDRLGNITFYVRTSLDPEQFLPNVPKVVAKLDANLPVEDLRTMPQQIRQNVFLDLMISVLSAAFAGLATLLAAIGLYGVLAYTVSQRTREIGLRMPLGAAPSRVRGMVLRQVGIMTIVGGIIGLTAAIWLGRLAQSLLFEMKGYDPVVLVSAAAALTVVALGAGFVPAHRASQVDPMQALRYE